MLALDQSSSIVVESYDNWAVRVLGFAKSVADAFIIGRNMTQIGLMKFNETTEIVFHLNTYDDRQSLHNAIDNVDIRGGDTNLAAALRTARQIMFTVQHGARSAVPKILILLTDGTANVEESNTLPEANLTKAANIKLYTVGVTNAVDEDQLRVMASVPECFFFAPNFTLLSSVVQQIVEISCNETAAPNGKIVNNMIFNNRCQCKSYQRCQHYSHRLLRWLPADHEDLSLLSDLKVRHFLHHRCHHTILLLSSTPGSKLIFSTDHFMHISSTFPPT